MEDCLLGAAKLDWIDAVMFTYNFRVMQAPKMQEAVNACEKAGIGLVAMKSQAGGPGTPQIASEAKLEMVDRFLKRGFTDKQAKLKVIWENPQIASICSQMPNLTILSANVAAARDLTKLAREEFDSLRRYALETQADYCAGCGRPLPGGRGRGRAGERSHALPHVPPVLWRAGAGQADLRRAARGGAAAVDRGGLLPGGAGLPAKAGHRPAHAPGRGDVGLTRRGAINAADEPGGMINNLLIIPLLVLAPGEFFRGRAGHHHHIANYW